MLVMSATKVRNEWSAVVDTVIRDKPMLIKRTRDYMFLSDVGFLNELLTAYVFHAQVFTEDDGSTTISLDEIDLIENSASEQEALLKLAEAIYEYSKDYYNDYSYWARGDRKAHMPYVIKSLLLDDVEKIGGLIQCRHGKS